MIIPVQTSLNDLDLWDYFGKVHKDTSKHLSGPHARIRAAWTCTNVHLHTLKHSSVPHAGITAAWTCCTNIHLHTSKCSSAPHEGTTNSAMITMTMADIYWRRTPATRLTDLGQLFLQRWFAVLELSCQECILVLLGGQLALQLGTLLLQSLAGLRQGQKLPLHWGRLRPGFFRLALLILKSLKRKDEGVEGAHKFFAGLFRQDATDISEKPVEWIPKLHSWRPGSCGWSTGDYLGWQTGNFNEVFFVCICRIQIHTASQTVLVSLILTALWVVSAVTSWTPPAFINWHHHSQMWNWYHFFWGGGGGAHSWWVFLAVSVGWHLSKSSRLITGIQYPISCAAAGQHKLQLGPVIGKSTSLTELSVAQDFSLKLFWKTFLHFTLGLFPAVF